MTISFALFSFLIHNAYSFSELTKNQKKNVTKNINLILTKIGCNMRSNLRVKLYLLQYRKGCFISSCILIGLFSWLDNFLLCWFDIQQMRFQCGKKMNFVCLLIRCCSDFESFCWLCRSCRKSGRREWSRKSTTSCRIWHCLASVIKVEKLWKAFSLWRSCAECKTEIFFFCAQDSFSIMKMLFILSELLCFSSDLSEIWYGG